ncbi:MAG: hypothetical protein GC202_09830 [Alphaproteobacteria bacterium]|nr:hypothetical protein [Alphaproteobacteria bacterium]
MRRISALIVLFLASCAPAAPAGPVVRASLPDGGRTLEIRVRDRQPLAEARLVLAGGPTVPAKRLTVHVPAPERPGVGVGASGGSSSGIGTGISFSVPLDWLSGASGGTPVESFAAFALPEGADMTGAKLDLAFGQPPAALRRVEMALPAR